MCPDCRMPIGQCACPGGRPLSTGTGAVRVSRETRGRNGKSVTVIRGLALDGHSLAALGKELRTTCGSGGTVKDGMIEVQGDHIDRIVELLAKRFGNVRRAGG